MSEYLIIDTAKQSVIQPTPQFKCSGYGLVELLKDKGNIVGLEIGCDAGDTAHFLLSSLPGLTLHSVDPYENYLDWNGNMLNNRQQVLQMATDKLTQFGDRYTLHRKTSDDAVNDFADGQFDFIFIDGLHTYTQLIKDCNNYYSKVKDGCLFSGHDYNVIAEVNKAVKEIAAQKQKEISTCDCDVWYWYK
jgi:predicted O-methyltransferase YrrM